MLVAWQLLRLAQIGTRNVRIRVDAIKIQAAVGKQSAANSLWSWPISVAGRTKFGLSAVLIQSVMFASIKGEGFDTDPGRHSAEHLALFQVDH
jgi:hypothetical protein